MTNIYIFWKETADPPSPWTRLTRTNQYLRCNSSTAKHWTSVGSSTHIPVPSSNYTSYSNNTVPATSPYSTYYTEDHRHLLTASYPSANNTPPAYGLDIIYMDLTLWESTKRIFPDGTVLVSNGVLTDAGYLSRFTDADDKFIVNTTPGTTAGSTSTHSHSTNASVGNSPVPIITATGNGAKLANAGTVHNHGGSVSISSTSTYQEPAYVVTRLYEVLAETTKTLSGTVVFVDGIPGSLWSILTTWNGKNLKSGNYNPTFGGSDTHSHTLSGTLATWQPTLGIESIDGGFVATSYIHNHTYSSATTDSNIPSSRYLIPVRLLTTVYRPMSGASPQIVGLSAW